MALSSSFAALRHRNFRLLWFGQLVSMSGSMMQNAAVLWHVSELAREGERGLALGLVGLVKVVPIVACSIAAGVAADALDRRKVMLVTQTAMTLVAATLAFVTFRGLDELWPIYLLTALSSAAGAFDGPSRQSLVPALVPVADFPNAISLNTTLFQFAAVLGPAVAGPTIANLGMGWVYALNAASFVSVIVALLLMRDVPARAQEHKGDLSWKAAFEGLKYVFEAPLIRSSMLLDFFATFFASALALLPIFAKEILHVDAEGYGILVAAPALGALVASIALVLGAGRIVQRGRWLLWSVAAYGAATIVFGVSTSFWLTFACLAASGIADSISTVLRNVIRQLATPDRLRGRMTGVNMIFFMGGPQLGEVEAGVVAHVAGAPTSVVTGGIGCLVATAWIAWKTPELRRYRSEA